jgi:hypothetical protein
VPKIIGPKGKPNPYRIINIQELKHRVMAAMDRRLARTLPWDVILFQTLSIQLRAYAKSVTNEHFSVIVVVDLDRHNERQFRDELEAIFCTPKPLLKGGVCLAVEEGEAWILGDTEAILHAYPFAEKYILKSYQQDSICGTWEVLADAIFNGGSERLAEIGYPGIGREKHRWAENIAQYMDVQKNQSPSFQTFRKLLLRLADV